MKLRNPTRRRRVVVPGRLVRGEVSPVDIEGYLLATGWRPKYLIDGASDYWDMPGIAPNRSGWPSDVPIVFVRGEGEGLERIPSPRERPPRPDRFMSLSFTIKRIASAEGRSPGEVLRDIEACARWAGRGEG